MEKEIVKICGKEFGKKYGIRIKSLKKFRILSLWLKYGDASMDQRFRKLSENGFKLSSKQNLLFHLKSKQN